MLNRFPPLLALACALVNVSLLRADDLAPGKAIYLKQCASCHGENGEGVQDQYADVLIGDRSLKELTKYINDRMPEEAPETCVGEEAEQVARYIYESFYSEIAQARNRPASIDLSRLTVRQYENTIADLLGGFTGGSSAAGEPGLQGEYFNSNRPRRDKRVIERVDPQIDFSFGEASPEAEKIEAGEFSMSWKGSVFAPTTGEYEFIVESENGVRLWVNSQKELIDAWVRSGNDTVYRGSTKLLGGRWYRIQLDFFKFKEKTASVRLKWKPPHQAEELIPQRALSTAERRSVFVISTPFPPDDRSTGYEVGTSISQAWQEATTYAALEVAGHVAANLDRYAGTNEKDEQRAKKIQQFCVQFVERAFRRPLDEQDRTFFVESQFVEGAALELGVKKVVLLALKSPRFLYREYGFGPFDQFDVASWLAYTCWDSLPDETLRKAAEQGRLSNREEIAKQVERLLSDQRAKAKMKDFLHQWLNVGHLDNIVKSQQVYPDFNESIASDLRTSLDLFLEEVVWSESSNFQQLFLSAEIYLNGRLARFYGVDLAENASFEKVSLEQEGRAGVLSHPFLMAGFSYDTTSSPIHRGVYISRGLLGRRLKPPPIAVAPLAPDLHEGLNTRERVILQTSPPTCMSCHAMINPLGFALENFDAVGRFRAEEKGRPVDAAGSYLDRQGNENSFVGANGLAKYLASSPETHEAFVEQLFQFFTKQPVRAFGEEQLPTLTESFVQNNFHIRRILTESIVDSAVKVQDLLNKRTGQTLSRREHR